MSKITNDGLTRSGTGCFSCTDMVLPETSLQADSIQPLVNSKLREGEDCFISSCSCICA